MIKLAHGTFVVKDHLVQFALLVCLLWYEQPTSGHSLSQRKVTPYPREINFQVFLKCCLDLGSPSSIHSEILSDFEQVLHRLPQLP